MGECPLPSYASYEYPHIGSYRISLTERDKARFEVCPHSPQSLNALTHEPFKRLSPSKDQVSFAKQSNDYVLAFQKVLAKAN